jgi:acyl carrier protein
MSIEEFITLVRVECGLPVERGDLHTRFDDLTGWDSVYLLKLLAVLEAATGQRLSAGQLFEARALADVHSLVVDA